MWVGSRRRLLRSLAAVASAPMLAAAAHRTGWPPIRTITRGPRFHWFGYYDKFAFDPTDRFVLANEVDFEHRSPTQEDRIGVGMVDLDSGDEWVPLGESGAWCWQQGCMLQWRPGSESQVIWNDREQDRFVGRLLDVSSGNRISIDRPIYTISPDGAYALTVDFSRLDAMRPGYGYSGLRDPHESSPAPKESGVWRIDLANGEERLLLSLAEIAEVPNPDGSTVEGWHYFNHLLINPRGDRFVVLHRSRSSPNKERDGRSGFRTRMITCSVNGGEVRVVNPSNTSHFVWRDDTTLCAWGKSPLGADYAFYLLPDGDAQPTRIGAEAMTKDGHISFMPAPHDNWALNDTYPQGPRRLQRPYLFHTGTGSRIDLGEFELPLRYDGEWRCDLHPRSNRRGSAVAIDSPHAGSGRQVHLIEVGRITND